MKVKEFLVTIVFILAVFVNGFTQIAPAGIGGTSDSPKLLFWLVADSISGLNDGDQVSAWNDISGSGIDFSASSGSGTVLPTFQSSGINSHSVVRFSTNSNSVTSTLVHKNFNNFPQDKISVFVVMNTSDGNSGVLSYANASNDNAFLLFSPENLNVFVNNYNKTSSLDFRNSPKILFTQWRNSDGSLIVERDGGNSYNTTLRPGDVITQNGCLAIGSEQDAVDDGYEAGQALDGDIAEVIIYADYLNTVQKTIIDNYLSIKYGISIQDDKYTGNDAAYVNDLRGIGQEADGYIQTANSAGFIVDADLGSLDDGDYILFAHDGAPNSSADITGADLPAGVEKAWNRKWYVEQTGSVSAKIEFDFSEGLTDGKYPVGISNYVLLYRSGTSGQFQVVKDGADGIEQGDRVYFTLNASQIQNGYYTLGTKDETNSPVEGSTGRSWYTLASGDWDDWQIWTLDPSGALPNNPDHLTPSTSPSANADKVYILSGKTVTVNSNGLNNQNITIDGTLDLTTTTGHSFVKINGTGIIRLAGDNFPAGDATHFVTSGKGEGTVVYYGGSYNLSNARQFYNVEINLNNSTDTLTLLADYKINGDLSINKGILKINDNTSTTALNIDVYGDVTVNADGGIRVGKGDARHQFNFYGDFLSKGVVKFTNRTSQDPNNEATDGIVDANFLSSTQDQSITCEDTTVFYRIEINKGTDATYVLNIDATQPDYFKLYGAANYNIDPPSGVETISSNQNALGLINGTVRIGSNIVVDPLNNVTNYSISSTAALWVDGGTVRKDQGSSLVPYGELKITDGLVEALVSSGVTLRGRGAIRVDGGTLNTYQIRTSVYGVNYAQGAYIQTGGTVNIYGYKSSFPDYFAFTLPYNGNIFLMSGGTLHIYDANGTSESTGGIFINSDPSNVNVTGGTVICEIKNTSRTFKINSRAPFWNLILRNTHDNTTDFKVDTAKNIGSDNITLAPQPLVVLNDLTIEDNAYLDNNNQDIYIGSNFYISRNTQKDASGNTNNYGLEYDNTDTYHLIFNGTETGYFTIDYDNDDGYELYVPSVVVNKSNDTSRIILKSGPAKDPDNVSNEPRNRILHVVDTMEVIRGIFDQGRQSARMFGEVYVYKRGQLGHYVKGVTPNTAYIMFRAGDLTVHSEKGAKFGNIKFNSTGTVTFTSDVIITRIGYFRGLYNIGRYNLKVKYLNNQSTNNPLGLNSGSTTKMIYTDGKAGDGGISLFIPANTADGTTLALPIGTKANGDTRYTPVQMELYNVTDSGYIQVRLADEVLATTNPNGGDILSYYWRISFEGFDNSRPTVIWRFKYSDNDVQGNDAQYVAGRVDDNFPFNRTYEDDPSADLNSVDETNNNIIFDGSSGNGIELDSICFTAGLQNRFTGSVEVYYTNGDNERWDDANIWHKGSKTGSTGEIPQEGSVAIIYRDGTGGKHEGRIWADGLNTSPTPSMVLFQIDRGVYPDVNTENQPRLQFRNSGTYHVGRVSGPGMISINVDANPTVIGDFGDFSRDSCATLMYGWSASGTYTLTSVIEPVPSLMFETKTFVVDTTLDINYDLIFNGTPNVTFKKNVTIGRDFLPGFWQGGILHFPAHGKPVTVIVKGNIDFTKIHGTNGTRRIVVDDPGKDTTLIHRLIVYGDINMNNNADDSISLFNTQNRPAVILELAGDTSARLYNAATIPNLYRIVMNKGGDQSLSFTFEDNFYLNGRTDTTNKAIELQNGTLVLNDPAIDVALSTGGDDFYIPSTAALEVRQGRVYVQGDDNGILLDGKLKISGGTVDMATGTGNGNNYIEYSGSGNATIEITSGELRVGSQVRRGLSSDNGILKYYQSGGTALFGISGAAEDKRSIFEVLNLGSVFSLTGGVFAIVNDYRTNPQIASLYIDPETINISSNHTINIGYIQTQTAGNTFTIYTTKPLERLHINNISGKNPSLTLYNVPLTLNGDLVIDANASFNAAGYDITIKGYWTNQGSFTAGGNKVYFTGTLGQQIDGNTTFYDLYKTSSNTVTLENSTTITVEHYLSLEDGVFNTKTGEILAKGNVYSKIPVQASGSSYGVVLGGSDQQVLSGNGVFDRLMIDNINGVFIPTGYTITINDSLLLSKGVFDIGKNLLVLTKDAEIIPVNPFSQTNMIQTNISFTDAGIKKYFPQISSATTFVYPIGSNGKYTPVIFDITKFEPDNSSIRVKSSDERHPSIQEDSESPDPEIVDSLNVLQYYWIMDADGVTNFEASVTMQAIHKDVKFTSPYDSTDYITARLLNRNNGMWDKYTKVAFNELTDELYFHFYGTNDPGIDGDYTAGVDGPDFNGAIPDQVPLYITKQDGPWTDTATWTPKPPQGGPKGARVLIRHNVVVPRNYIVSYMTTIDGTGTLDIGSTFGHRLGVVSGTGLLRMSRGELPAGDYDNFFAPDSGTIEFYGSTDYDILSEIAYVNNLILSGSGQRKMPNLNLKIYGSLTVNGPTAFNQYSEDIYVYKNLNFTSGQFDAQSGKLIFCGTARQYINGPASLTGANALYDMEVDNVNGIELQTDVEITNILTFVAGQVYTSTTNLLTLTNTGDNPIVGAGYGKFVNGPLAKKIINGHGFDFPVGNSGRYGDVKVDVPSSLGATYTWVAQYFNRNPGNDGYDPTQFASPLKYVSTNEYWRVWSDNSAQATVTLRWDSQSGVPSSASDRSNYLEIARWSFANTRWEREPSTIVDNSSKNYGKIQTSSDISFNDDNTQGDLLTLASNYCESFDWVGTKDTVWTDPDNWSSTKVPGAFNDVVIKSTATHFPAITTQVEVKSMNIESGAKVTIYAPGALTVNSDLQINGSLIMEAPDGVGTYPSLLTNGNVQISGGTFQEKLYLKQKKFHYVSSPLASGNATSDLYCKNRPDGRFNPNFYTYDETVDLDGNPGSAPSGSYDSQNLASGWVVAHNGSSGAAVPMQTSQGYALWDESDRLIAYQGVPNNGDLDVTGLSYTDNDPVPEQETLPNFYDGWHLMGNPYPSYINWDSIAQSLTNMDNAIYIWDGNQYASYVNGVANGNISKFIAPMQGYFIHVNADNAGFTQNNACRSHSTTQQFLKSAKVKKSTPGNILRLSMDIGTGSDIVTIYFTPRATDEFDSRYDAFKMFSYRSNKSVPDLYTIDRNILYSIEALPLESMYNDTVPVGLVMKTNGTATISVAQMNFDEPVDIYLYDKQLDSNIVLNPGTSYTFTSGSGKITDRFELRFYKEVPPTAKLDLGHVYVYEDEPLYKVYEQKAFTDYNGDKVTVSVVDQNGKSLDWIRYDDEFNTLIINAGNDQVGDHHLRLIGTDDKGESNEIQFTVTVINVNDAPELVGNIPDMTVDMGNDVAINVAQYFEDIDRGDTLTYQARLTDGSQLPMWLNIDPHTGQITGVAYDPGVYDIEVIAQDKAGEKVSDNFTLTVQGLATDVNGMDKDEIVLYPNPAHDFVQVYNGFDKNVTLRIYDETGKLMIKREMTGSKELINVKGLPQGKYLVQFDLGDKTMTQKLIVK